MTNVFDTAVYILEKLGKLSTLKLQKLCYYSQAWSLVWDDAPLFSEDFYAWANGPVCKELFCETQGRFSVSAEDEPGDSSKLTENQKDTINKVLEHYGSKSAQWLSQLTHLEDPWKNAKRDSLISKESIANYYGSL